MSADTTLDLLKDTSHKLGQAEGLLEMVVEADDGKAISLGDDVTVQMSPRLLARIREWLAETAPQPAEIPR